MAERLLIAEATLDLSPTNLDDARTSFSSMDLPPDRQKAIAEAISVTFRGRLASAVGVIGVGTAVFLWAFLWRGLPLSSFFSAAGMIIAGGGVIFLVSAIADRATGPPRKFSSIGDVCNAFYRTVLSTQDDWALAFACLSPLAETDLPSRTPAALEHVWKEPFRRARLLVLESFCPTVRCSRCGLEKHRRHTVGTKQEHKTRSQFWSGPLAEFADYITAHNFFRCVKCGVCLCGHCFSESQPEDKCSECGAESWSRFRKGLWEEVYVISDDDKENGPGWSCVFVVSPRMVSADAALVSVDVRLTYGGGFAKDRELKGEGVIRFNNGVVRDGDSWFLVSGLPGDLRTSAGE